MKTIALDFDGVVNSYSSGWKGINTIPDPPIPGSFEFIENAINNGYGISIFSCRADTKIGREAILQWFADHGLPGHCLIKIKISSNKPKAIIYIDDRGWRFTGQFPTLETISNLKPWNQT